MMKMRDVTSSIPTSNYSTSRDGHRPTAIVLHITADSTKNQSVSWFQNPSSKVSAHYVIEKDGICVMCVHPSHRAYHAGEVISPTAQIYFDKGKINPNLYSIGIECVSNGEPLTDEQLISLKELVITLCDGYKLPRTRYTIIGHNELNSVSRKFDPIKSYNPDKIVEEITIVEVDSSYKDCVELVAKTIGLNSRDYWMQHSDKNVHRLIELMANYIYTQTDV